MRRLRSRARVRPRVVGGKVAPSLVHFALPPVRIGLVDDVDHVEALELQLVRFGRFEVVDRLHQAHVQIHVLQLDVRATGDARRSMVVDQFV